MTPFSVADPIDWDRSRRDAAQQRKVLQAEFALAYRGWARTGESAAIPALRAVIDLHYPMIVCSRIVCAECEGCDCEQVAWPCRTWTAIVDAR